jgi:hypothetical protein
MFDLIFFWRIAMNKKTELGAIVGLPGRCQERKWVILIL